MSGQVQQVPWLGYHVSKATYGASNASNLVLKFASGTRVVPSQSPDCNENAFMLLCQPQIHDATRVPADQQSLIADANVHGRRVRGRG